MQKLLIFVLLFTLAVPSFAQAPIQVTTRLVQVAVVVRDKHGAVADLTKGDFEIQDKGKSRQIATFSVARGNAQPTRSTLPPNTFSNRLNQQNDPPITATVILFDRLNTTFKDQVTAREQVLGYLKEIDPTTPTAVYTLGNDLRILHDFTESREQLVAALQRYRAGTSTLLANSTISADDPLLTSTPPSLPGPTSAPPLSTTASPAGTTDWLAEILSPLTSFALDRRVAITLSALQVIANRMAGVPGRKNLIWISGAFPLTLAFDRGGLAGGGQRVVTYAGDMKEAATAIDRANVALYPVDARGLMVSESIRTAMPQPINQGATGQTYSIPTPEAMIGTREIETMKLMADWTGGKAFYNTNDIRGALKQANEDAEVTYTLGFYADEKELDGSYHELKVKVARKGTDVRYRRGYFATPLTAVASQSGIDVLRNALASPADATAMGLTAALVPNTEQPGSYLLTLGMDLANLALAAKNERWSDSLNFVVAQQNAGGGILDSVSNTIAINITEENREKLLKDGLGLKIGITPVKGLNQIRVAVMDQATGNVGSLRIAIPTK